MQYDILGQFGPVTLAFMATDPNASEALVAEIKKTLSPLCGPEDMEAMISAANHNLHGIYEMITRNNN